LRLQYIAITPTVLTPTPQQLIHRITPHGSHHRL
jgi:hypothetical protein